MLFIAATKLFVLDYQLFWNKLQGHKHEKTKKQKQF